MCSDAIVSLNMSERSRLFLILWLAGISGVLSFLLVDIGALVASLPLPAGSPPPELPHPAILKLATFLQPAILMSVAVLVGIWLAPKVGLHAPAAEAIAERKPIWPALAPQIVPGVIGGLACGIAIALTWMISKPFLPTEFITRAEEFNKFIPHAVRIFYGGLAEEILLRWGFMTFLVWLAWRVLVTRSGSGDEVPAQPPHATIFVAAIIVSALAFGAGHLPIASILAGGLTLPIVAYVITANAIFGIAAGSLYWKRGLESAMIAHIFAHIILIAAIYFSL